MNETKRIEYLFELYDRDVGGMFGKDKVKGKKEKKAIDVLQFTPEELASNVNPFETGPGFPIEGKAEEFFAWARAKELFRRQFLSPEEQKRLQQTDMHMAKKMNS